MPAGPYRGGATGGQLPAALGWRCRRAAGLWNCGHHQTYRSNEGSSRSPGADGQQGERPACRLGDTAAAQLAASYKLLLADDASGLRAYGTVSTTRPTYRSNAGACRSPGAGGQQGGRLACRLGHTAAAQLAASYQLLLAGDAIELRAYGTLSTTRPAHRSNAGAPRSPGADGQQGGRLACRLGHTASKQRSAVGMCMCGGARDVWPRWLLMHPQILSGFLLVSLVSQRPNKTKTSHGGQPRTNSKLRAANTANRTAAGRCIRTSGPGWKFIQGMIQGTPPI